VPVASASHPPSFLKTRPDLTGKLRDHVACKFLSHSGDRAAKLS
jgi:hypothetical protein